MVQENILLRGMPHYIKYIQHRRINNQKQLFIDDKTDTKNHYIFLLLNKKQYDKL